MKDSTFKKLEVLLTAFSPLNGEEEMLALQDLRPYADRHAAALINDILKNDFVGFSEVPFTWCTLVEISGNPDYTEKQIDSFYRAYTDYISPRPPRKYVFNLFLVILFLVTAIVAMDAGAEDEPITQSHANHNISSRLVRVHVGFIALRG